jgi:hypothetical protein
MTLMEEAGSIFGLDPAQIILMLFSLTPVTLDRNGHISGPPTPGPAEFHGVRVCDFCG